MLTLQRAMAKRVGTVRSLPLIAALAAAALSLAACQDRHSEPVPPPKTLRTATLPAALGTRLPCRRAGVSEIYWFQGTLDEAFARHSDKRALLRY
jgi:hypothetical protein